MAKKARNIIFPALFCALMIVGAVLKISLPWVPFSFQTFFAVACGLILPWRQALAAQLLYIALGLAGIPVFTGGGGISYIFSPTFGYIIGFAACSALCGLIKDLSDKSFKALIYAAFVGIFANYAIGVPYLYYIVKFISGKGAFTFSDALAAGLAPFIAKDLLLSIVAVLVAHRVNRAVNASEGAARCS